MQFFDVSSCLWNWFPNGFTVPLLTALLIKKKGEGKVVYAVGIFVDNCLQVDQLAHCMLIVLKAWGMIINEDLSIDNAFDHWILPP